MCVGFNREEGSCSDSSSPWARRINYPLVRLGRRPCRFLWVGESGATSEGRTGNPTLPGKTPLQGSSRFPKDWRNHLFEDFHKKRSEYLPNIFGGLIEFLRQVGEMATHLVLREDPPLLQDDTLHQFPQNAKFFFLFHLNHLLSRNGFAD